MDTSSRLTRRQFVLAAAVAAGGAPLPGCLVPLWKLFREDYAVYEKMKQDLIV